MQDAFAEVTFDHVVTLLDEVRIEFTLFGEHGFTLDQLLHAVIAEDALDDVTILLVVFGKVHVATVCCSVFFELLDELRQVRIAVELDVTGGVAQVFPFGDGVREEVAFVANHVKRLVVPNGILFIG